MARGSTAARGYGWRHQQLRAAWKRKVEAGIVFCARCGRLIPPGAPFDLGHSDYDRTQYTGPEHVACNRATAKRKRVYRKRKVRLAQLRVHSREW